MHTHLTLDPRYQGYNGLEFTDNFWTAVGVENAKKTLEAPPGLKNTDSLETVNLVYSF
jgi:hypothetical protein